MISVAVYQIEYDADKQVSYVEAVEAIICSACDSSELIKKGWRRRKLILLTGTLMIFMVRRVRCKNCGKIHHVLPNTIIPYKRYDAETIEKITEGDPNETRCEESTINRIKAWWSKMRFYVLVIAASMTEGRKIQITTEPKLVQTVRALVNIHLWPGYATQEPVLRWNRNKAGL